MIIKLKQTGVHFVAYDYKKKCCKQHGYPRVRSPTHSCFNPEWKLVFR